MSKWVLQYAPRTKRVSPQSVLDADGDDIESATENYSEGVYTMGKIEFDENGFAYYQESEASEKVTLEGYLSSEKEYNCVLFLLRESNSNNETPTRFWFKDVCTKERAEKYFSGKSNTRAEKTIASKFRNRFSELLTYTEEVEKELCKSAFLNLNPNGGGNKESAEYKKAVADFEKGAGKRREAIEALKPKYIFTCSDIFDAIAKANSIETISSDGVKYKNKPTPKRRLVFNNQKCTLIEIDHPSRSPKIDK